MEAKDNENNIEKIKNNVEKNINDDKTETKPITETPEDGQNAKTVEEIKDPADFY